MRHLSLPFPSFSRGKSAEYDDIDLDIYDEMDARSIPTSLSRLRFEIAWILRRCTEYHIRESI